VEGGELNADVMFKRVGMLEAVQGLGGEQEHGLAAVSLGPGILVEACEKVAGKADGDEETNQYDAFNSVGPRR
jgi:hypothetical protein